MRRSLRRLAAVAAADLRALQETAPAVTLRTDGVLRTEDLAALVQLESTALHVKGFYPAESCAALAAELLSQEQRNWEVVTAKGLESSDVLSVGTPFNVAQRSGADAVEAYFNESREVMRSLRGPDGSRLSPLDKLRLELDEAWPAGARLSKHEGKPFLAGLPRVMHGPTRWVQGFAHVDDISPCVPGKGLFSANVYLQVPGAGLGGGLEIWPVTWRDAAALENHIDLVRLFTDQTDEAQTRVRAALPPPLTIDVEAGDLVLLCAKRPHAVVGFPFGTRVSVQSFVSIDAEGDPMCLDT
mmetsp:Transcript_30355/g.96870  ORF Transcript_30355/g.96870 Transcript_30355/m.96870 type:complete len:299 (-) Transcript_30355:180-1076(-)